MRVGKRVKSWGPLVLLVMCHKIHRRYDLPELGSALVRAEPEWLLLFCVVFVFDIAITLVIFWEYRLLFVIELIRGKFVQYCHMFSSSGTSVDVDLGYML